MRKFCLLILGMVCSLFAFGEQKDFHGIRLGMDYYGKCDSVVRSLGYEKGYESENYHSYRLRNKKAESEITLRFFPSQKIKELTFKIKCRDKEFIDSAVVDIRQRVEKKHGQIESFSSRGDSTYTCLGYWGKYGEDTWMLSRGQMSDGYYVSLNCKTDKEYLTEKEESWKKLKTDIIIFSAVTLFFIICVYIFYKKKEPSTTEHSMSRPYKEAEPEKDEPKEDESKETLEVKIESLGEERFRNDDPIDRTFSTYIAGLSHYCDPGEHNVFVGCAVPEPGNKYDKNAVRIITTEGQILGYVPKSELKAFNEWSDRKPIPCVGYYEPEGDTFHSNVKFIRPYTPDFIKEEVDRYFEWFKKKKLNK